MLKDIQQLLITERFSQELNRAKFHGLNRHRYIRIRGDEDDWDLNARLDQLVLEIQAAHPGKSYVEN